MKVRNIDILEVKLIKFDSKTGEMKLQVSFIDDTPIFTSVNVENSHEEMAEKVLTAVKQQKKPVDDEDDDLLGGIAIINISNDDELRERFGKGVMRIEQRFDTLKRTRSATEYMKAYTSISTSEDIIYRKGC